MSEETGYAAGKKTAKGVLCFCAACLLVLVLLPALPYSGLDHSGAAVQTGSAYLGFNGYQIAVSGKYKSLVMTQPFTDMPAGGGLDKSALDEMVGKGYARSYSSDPMSDISIQDEMMSSGSKRAGRAGSRKSDSEGSIFGGTSRESDSGGWLVRSFNEADDTASETAAPRDGLFDRSTRNSGSMMDGEKRDGIGLYGDKEPGEM